MNRQPVRITAAALLFALASPAWSQNAPPLDARASDPKALGWMQGSPPPADKVIKFGDGSAYRFPQTRWSIYVDPKAEMVIARFASHPVAANAGNDPVTLPAFHALALHLIANPR